MSLDLVHDIQGVYRKVLNSMARPGAIESIIEETNKVDINIDCYKSTFLMMLMLLDGEVSFNVISNKSMDITSLVSQITYSKVKPIEEADYIFIMNDAISASLEEGFKRAKIGSLINPNKSATIIAELDDIGSGKELILKGPGIKEESKVSVKGNLAWVDVRAERNEEYPLGVDSIFVDDNGNLICLPRTTQIGLKGE